MITFLSICLGILMVESIVMIAIGLWSFFETVRETKDIDEWFKDITRGSGR